MIYVNAPLTFGLAIETADREAIYRLRVENYLTDSPYLLKDSPKEHFGKDRFDDESLLFYAKHRGAMAASCRLTPHGVHGWEARGGAPDALLPEGSDQIAQFNRTLVDRSFRNRNLHAPLFYFVSEWVLKHTRLRHYFSVCTVPLYRFYAAYGAVKRTDAPFSIAGREPNRYFLIEGRFSLTNALLKQQLIKKDCLPVPCSETDTAEEKEHGEDTIPCRDAI